MKNHFPKPSSLGGHHFLGESVIWGHHFNYSKRKGSGLQKFVFARADKMHHRVCVVLEYWGRRLYGSFADAGAFWQYYSTFKGKRCFYWINRSFELQEEVSLLHLDVEWLTDQPDPLAEQKLNTICEAVQASLPMTVEILREDLSRRKFQSRWKNSFHLYPMVTLEHNSENCMRTFVKKKVWPKLEQRRDMHCPFSKKPILDLDIYTKNRVFRVPGSSKYEEYVAVKMPSRDFFMRTKMADRLSTPQLTTNWIRSMGCILNRMGKRLAKKNSVDVKESYSRKKKRRLIPSVNMSCAQDKAASFQKTTSESLVNTMLIDPLPRTRKIEQQKVAVVVPRQISSSYRWFEQVGHTPGPCPISRDPNQYPGRRSSNKASSVPQPNQMWKTSFVSNPSEIEYDSQPMKKQRREVQTSIRQIISESSKSKIVLDRIWCPVSGCGNFGGRGYKRSYIVKHLNSHTEILKARAEEREKVAKVLREFSGHICCKNCCFVVGQANDGGLCKSCAKKCIRETGPVAPNLAEEQKQKLVDRIRSANRTRLRILSDIPKSLRSLWGDCVSAILLEFAKAKTELESFTALEKWVKLKSALVLPLKGGKQRFSANVKFHSHQMELLFSGEHEECWRKATVIEKERQKLIKKKKQSRNITSANELLGTENVSFHSNNDNNPNSLEKSNETLTKVQKNTYKRAKNYVNLGELSKAMTSLRSNGIAEVTDSVLVQLQAKHPRRPREVKLPSLEQVRMDKEEFIEDEESKEESEENRLEFSKSVSDVINSVLPSVVVGAAQILQAAKKARRLTSGGLQQITPWLLKRALLADSKQEGAIAAGRLATRWAKGDFDKTLGELVAESQLIALYKDESHTDVRPIGVGCSLRRLLTRACCSEIQAQIVSHVRGSQLGVLKGGYEVGVHAMRELTIQARKNGWVIMLLDFENAFNTVDRNLMLRLASAHCPELVKLTLWLYGREPHLVTTRGDTVKSSTGTQQGCTLSNPLFALTMEFFAQKIRKIGGLRVKQFFWDDSALVGTPAAVVIAAGIIQKLSPETGLNLKWKKCHLHGTPDVIEKCKLMLAPSFSSDITFHPTLNMIYLKAPIGSNEFAAIWLNCKLKELKDVVSVIVQMPHSHEACTLLRCCGAECRVTYLMRILPPRQIHDFMLKFNKILRKGFEKLIGTTLSEKWWRLAQLTPKFGGMSMRSGLTTYGAQHLVSLAKSAAEVERIVGKYDVLQLAKRETQSWLNHACSDGFDIEEVVAKHRAARHDNELGHQGSQIRYSIAQTCELHEHKKVLTLMSREEKIHIEAHSGPDHRWVTLLPLTFKRYNYTSAVFIASARRRLRLDVLRMEKQCTFCKWCRCDVKGDHAVMCSGGASRILRHNNIRDIIAKAVRDVGLRTDIEHGGGLGDQRRPGDVIVYNWCGGKHLLIDVAVINPLAISHSYDLVKDGVGSVGSPATAYETVKRNIYPDLDYTIYDFVPFVVETCGGIGDAARSFCKELRRRRAEKIFGEVSGEEEWRRYGDPLLTAINVEVQRFNSQMILERKPVPENLIESCLVKSEMALAKRRAMVRDKIRAKKKSECSFTPRPEENQLKAKSGRGVNMIARGESMNVTINLKQPLKQLPKDDRILEGTTGAKIQRQRFWEDDPPDPPDPPSALFSQHNTRIRDSEAWERTMAVKLKTTGQSTSTKVKVLYSQRSSKSTGETAMEVDYTQPDLPIHWEPPEVQRFEEKPEYLEPSHLE